MTIRFEYGMGVFTIDVRRSYRYSDGSTKFSGIISINGVAYEGYVEMDSDMNVTRMRRFNQI